LNGKIQIGQVVKSISGRDQNRYFIIVSIVDDENVLISDGKLRKIQNPKLKKLKHLKLMSAVSENMNKINYKDLQSQNAFIRKELEKLGYSNKREV